jgi:hypothetical protein
MSTIPAVFWHLAHGVEVARSPVPCPGLCQLHRLHRPVDDVREKDDEEERRCSLRRRYRVRTLPCRCGRRSASANRQLVPQLVRVHRRRSAKMSVQPDNLLQLNTACKTPPRGVSAGSFKTFVTSCPGLCFRVSQARVRD